jgi:carbonic anhydrase/acetyltransferase-like protein (isoleucine patch superfamily)
LNPYFEKLKAQVKKGKNVFIAENAIVIGEVILEDYVSVWYNTVVRGDSDSITIGRNTNIQDNCVLHIDKGVPVKIGKNVTVGHGAIVHGCTIGDGCLIGMRSTIMNHAVIGKGCVIGSHALVPENMVIPDFSLVLGTPGRVVRQLNMEEVDRIQEGVQIYIERASKYL